MLKTIEVTQDDINNGVRKSETSCPIALALKRALPDRTIRADTNSLILCERSTEGECIFHKIVGTPLSVMTFIMKFDEQFPVQPFAFELDV